MKINYDSKIDVLSLILNPNTRIAESDETKPGIVLDYDAQGNLVSLELLDASHRVSETHKIEFETAS